MICGDINHWNDICGCDNLLFFAQLVNEQLSFYSMPAHRLSTLNSHYLCLDALSAIASIEKAGVPAGQLKPIMAELMSSLISDPVFDSSPKPLDYFLKTTESNSRVANNVQEMGNKELKNAAMSLNRLFFRDNYYYSELKKRIISIVIKNDSTEQRQLFCLTKSLLTELYNCGYDLRYIYRVANQYFWNRQNRVESPDVIYNFFDSFDFVEHNYYVVFKVKREKANRFIKFIEGIELQDSIDFANEDSSCVSFLKKRKDEVFITIQSKARDPFSAENRVCKIIDDNVAIFRLYNHLYNYKISSSRSCVFDEFGNSYMSFSDKNAVHHIEILPDSQINMRLDFAGEALTDAAKRRDFPEFTSLFKAIRFHSHALDSISKENQLLDFWAIFETIIDVSNQHTSDRIIQVCSVLVPILKLNYLYSLFNQLALDIKEYDSALYSRITGSSTDNDEIVKSVCEFVLLPEHEADRNNELSKIVGYPLLIERINYYHDSFATPKEVYAFIEKRAERIKWQIMRIYRNRNLIIHNGESMPYLGLLIENLHFYVDVFIEHIIHSMKKGEDYTTMCQELYINECDWVCKFSKNNSVIDKDTISEMLNVRRSR